jgi:Fe-S-cluster containining protein
MMNSAPAVLAAVEDAYRHIDQEVARWFAPADGSRLTDHGCNACGDCCDFDSYGHRLFVTTPEVVYLAEKLAPEKLRPMAAGRCPYNIEGKCSIHPYRFAGCRIFFCKGDHDKQSELSQWASDRFKLICEMHKLVYSYTDLRSALNSPKGSKYPV